MANKHTQTLTHTSTWPLKRVCQRAATKVKKRTRSTWSRSSWPRRWGGKRESGLFGCDHDTRHKHDNNNKIGNISTATTSLSRKAQV